MVVGGEGEEHVDTTAAAVEKEEEEEEKAAMSRLVMRFGVSCHACKVLQPRLWVCPRAPAHRWCAKCLRNRFGVAFAAAPAWPGLATARGCPACRGHCPCAACRRSGGSQPHQNSSGRPRMTTAAAAATEQPQRDGGGGGGTAERRERGFGRLMHEEHHDWTKVLDRDAYRSSLVFRKRFLSEAEGTTHYPLLSFSLFLSFFLFLSFARFAVTGLFLFVFVFCCLFLFLFCLRDDAPR